MGGWAFMIYGNFDAERAAAGAKPPSFFQRLRGHKAAAVSSTDMSRLLQFPADSVQQPLAEDYRAFVRTRLSPPNEASQSVLDYLELDQPATYIRASQDSSDGCFRSFTTLILAQRFGWSTQRARRSFGSSFHSWKASAVRRAS